MHFRTSSFRTHNQHAFTPAVAARAVEPSPRLHQSAAVWELPRKCSRHTRHRRRLGAKRLASRAGRRNRERGPVGRARGCRRRPQAGCWAVSSPPDMPGCGKSPSVWTCTTWRTSAAARRRDAAPKAGFHARLHFTLSDTLARFRRSRRITLLCRDRAYHLWQFGIRSKPARRPCRRAVRGFGLVEMRNLGLRILRLAHDLSINRAKKGWEELDGPTPSPEGEGASNDVSPARVVWRGPWPPWQVSEKPLLVRPREGGQRSGGCWWGETD